MILQESFTLSNGITIPKLGLGTWLIENDAAAELVRRAIEIRDGVVLNPAVLEFQHREAAYPHAQIRP